MGTTTAEMGLSKPTLGGDSGTWDDQLSASLDLIDTHTHVAGQGVAIPSGGLDLTTDVTLNGTAALTNVKAVSFTGQASYSVAKSLFVDSDDNELYWRSNAGVDVQLTDGAQLNLNFVGGIEGDYAATTASLYYEDAGKRYKMLQNGPSPDHWASVDCGDLKLYEKASAITNAVTLKSPSSLAASYTITWPAAVPAARQPVWATSAGVLTFGHGDQVLNLSSAAIVWDIGWGRNPGSGFIASTDIGIANTAELAVPLTEGDRIKSVAVTLGGGGVEDITIDVYRYTSAGGFANIGTVTVTNQNGVSTTSLDVTDTTLASGDAIAITFLPSGTAGIEVGNVRVTYDRNA